MAQAKIRFPSDREKAHEYNFVLKRGRSSYQIYFSVISYHGMCPNIDVKEGIRNSISATLH